MRCLIINCLLIIVISATAVGQREGPREGSQSYVQCLKDNEGDRIKLMDCEKLVDGSPPGKGIGKENLRNVHGRFVKGTIAKTSKNAFFEKLASAWLKVQADVSLTISLVDPYSTDIKCEVDPCANGGTCSDGEKGFTCECADGYIGTICQITDEPEEESTTSSDDVRRGN